MRIRFFSDDLADFRREEFENVYEWFKAHFGSAFVAGFQCLKEAMQTTSSIYASFGQDPPVFPDMFDTAFPIVTAASSECSTSLKTRPQIDVVVKMTRAIRTNPPTIAAVLASALIARCMMLPALR